MFSYVCTHERSGSSNCTVEQNYGVRQINARCTRQAAAVRAEALTTNKGRRGVKFQGHMYRLGSDNEEYIRWRCRTTGCPGRLTTDLNGETNPVVATDHQDACVPDPERVLVKTTIRNMKRRAADEVTSTNEIYRGEGTFCNFRTCERHVHSAARTYPRFVTRTFSTLNKRPNDLVYTKRPN